MDIRAWALRCRRVYHGLRSAGPYCHRILVGSDSLGRSLKLRKLLMVRNRRPLRCLEPGAMNLVSVQAWNNSPPFNRPRVRSGARSSMTVPGGPVRLLAFRAMPRGFGETISNPLGHAQSGLFGSLVIRLALCGRNPQFKASAEHFVRGFGRSPFGVCHNRHCTDRKSFCNPIDVRIILRTIKAVKQDTPKT